MFQNPRQGSEGSATESGSRALCSPSLQQFMCTHLCTMWTLDAHQKFASQKYILPADLLICLESSSFHSPLLLSFKVHPVMDEHGGKSLNDLALSFQ